MARPCVPTIRSWSRGCTTRSSTGTVGKPWVKRVQAAPPSSDTNSPVSVPANNTCMALGCSLTTLIQPTGGRPVASDFQVSPKSRDTNRYGAKSSS